MTENNNHSNYSPTSKMLAAPPITSPGSALKKNFTSLLTKPRPPLRPTNTNIPSPSYKRAKLNLGAVSPRKSTTNNPSPLARKVTVVPDATETSPTRKPEIDKVESNVEVVDVITISETEESPIVGSTTSSLLPIKEAVHIPIVPADQNIAVQLGTTKIEQTADIQIQENTESSKTIQKPSLPALQPQTETILYIQPKKLHTRLRQDVTESSIPVKNQLHIEKESSISTRKVERQVLAKKHNVQHQSNHSHHREQTHLHNNNNLQQQQSRAVGRLVGEEFQKWQQTWRKIISESSVYFEGVQEYNRKQFSDYRRASKLLRLVGCEIAPFYDNDVTIIVSRRPYDPTRSYPSNDIFSNVATLKTKVWNYDKVFRFLENLGINVINGADEYAVNTQTILPASLTADSTNKKNKDDLHNLLKDEKIFGSTDRDPNAKRDDLHYFGKNYLYVYDLSQKVRPIAIREWSDDSYTTLNMTYDGRCPFVSDPSDGNSERQKLRRQRKFEAAQEYRDLLRKATYNIMNNIKNGGVSMNASGFSGTSTSTDKAHDDEHNTTVVQNSTSSKKLEVVGDESGENIVPPGAPQTKFVQPHVPPSFIRNSSCFQSNSKPFDIFAASGYNGASNAVPFSLDSNLNSNAAGGNGLGPMVSQVPSRNLNNLKRRIIMKKRKSTAQDKRKDSRDSNPGYCENCRVKYDCFDEHILSNRHRNFACNDENFKDIDELIATLNESKSMGYVTYNGE